MKFKLDSIHTFLKHLCVFKVQSIKGKKTTDYGQPTIAKPQVLTALGRRPGTPQAGTPSGARDRQSDGGATAGPMQHLAELRGVQAGDRPFG